MTLHQLRIFECVVKHMNITKASQALHISQPSVSQQLRLLEQEFGTPFFVRLNHGVELTAQGRNLLTPSNLCYRKPQTSRTRSGIIRVQTKRVR